MVANPREGDGQTTIVISQTTTRYVTVGQFVNEWVAKWKDIKPYNVSDDIVLGYVAFQIAFEIERLLQMSDGAIQDKLPDGRDVTVGELIRITIKAYTDAGLVHRKNPWHGGQYPLPG